MAASWSPLPAALVLGAAIRGASGIAHTVTVGDHPAWAMIPGTYPDMSITLGETLKFVASSMMDVVLVHAPSSGTHWDQCTDSGISGGAATTIWASSDFPSRAAGERHYTPPTCGDYYIAASRPRFCTSGQRFKVTVANAGGGACTSPCADAACVTAESRLPMAGGVLHDVTPAPGTDFWGAATYDALTVDIGDTVLFKTVAGYHDVATVPAAADFDACDVSGATVVAAWTPGETAPSSACASSSTCCAGATCGASQGWLSTYTFTAATAGDTYFVCSFSDGGHCNEGQKLRITVLPPSSSSSRAVRRGAYPLLAVLALAAMP